MSYQCYNCNKKNWSSKRGLHHKGVAGGRWKHKAQKTTKVWKANLKKVRVLSDKTPVRVKLCTDCISKLRQKGTLKAINSVLHSTFYKPPQKAASK